MLPAYPPRRLALRVGGVVPPESESRDMPNVGRVRRRMRSLPTLSDSSLWARRF